MDNRVLAAAIAVVIIVVAAAAYLATRGGGAPATPSLAAPSGTSRSARHPRSPVGMRCCSGATSTSWRRWGGRT